MESLWSESEATRCEGDPLKQRVYTSQLLGRDPALVLHGGGNTSVKIQSDDLLGNPCDVLYVKGSGWDLATIEAEGFAPVRMDVLLRLADRETLSDTEMVRTQRAAMLNPDAPNPSVEAILHAIIPRRFVDHTHADAVLALTNSKDGERLIAEIFPERTLVLPYVMPGFVLARQVREATQDLDWDSIDSIILLNHGVFTFADDAKQSYEQMIQVVDQAEQYLRNKRAFFEVPASTDAAEESLSWQQLQTLAKVRLGVSKTSGKAMLACPDLSSFAKTFTQAGNLSALTSQGPLTPDHVIRTKRLPMLVDVKDPEGTISRYADDYAAYFNANMTDDLTMLDRAPRLAVWPEVGTIAFGASPKETGIITDIAAHTTGAIRSAEALGGWRALSAKEIFEIEYWELEQAKLKKKKSAGLFSGRIALVTGAASGIGRATANELLRLGAAVGCIDLSSGVHEAFDGNPQAVTIQTDVTDNAAMDRAVRQIASRFGGLDMLVSNAGVFTQGAHLDAMDSGLWQKSLDINLTSHMNLLRMAAPLLKQGIEPAVLFVGSKNVPAPGASAGAYSVAKAGLTQLARVAAIELAENNVRVNVIHPNAVFDTGAWSNDVLKQRAEAYGQSIENYKKRNLMQHSITSNDVAQTICALLGPAFRHTTGAQIPLDGGDLRVI